MAVLGDVLARWQETTSSCDALFNNLCFIFYFAPIVVATYWLLPRGRWRFAHLVASSVVFYSFWDIRFTALLLAGALLDYAIGVAMEATSGRTRKALLATSIAVNVSVLAAFKYAVFIAESAAPLLGALGSPPPGFSVLLPVGISFYTFQTMAYSIDVYQGKIQACRDPMLYLAFVTFFPQLVAGPIVRFSELGPQLADMRRWPAAKAVAPAIFIFSFALFKKVVIADRLGRWADPFWAQPSGDAVDAWSAIVGYSLQIYLDFSAYSEMAVALALAMGLALPWNFYRPYRAKNPQDFWKNWHVTLSHWFRDYVYIPMGGRGENKAVWVRNIVIVMAVAGLWHGAAWNFVVWGIYHGVLVAGYHLTRQHWEATPVWLTTALTLFLVVIGWVFFRAETLTDAGTALQLAFTGGLHIPSGREALRVGFILAVGFATIAITPMALRTWRPDWRVAVLAAVAFVVAVIALRSTESPFLYYQF